MPLLPWHGRATAHVACCEVPGFAGERARAMAQHGLRVSSRLGVRYPRRMSIDRGDLHYADAGTWERACRHMGLFLWWAAERGLAAEDHDVQRVRENATEYFISQCDTKLWDEDLTGEGNAFAKARYNACLGEVSAYAASLGVGAYEVPESQTTTDHIFDWLDASLAEWREKPNVGRCSRSFRVMSCRRRRTRF